MPVAASVHKIDPDSDEAKEASLQETGAPQSFLASPPLYGGQPVPEVAEQRQASGRDTRFVFVECPRGHAGMVSDARLCDTGQSGHCRQEGLQRDIAPA